MIWLRLAVLSLFLGALSACAQPEQRGKIFASYQAHMLKQGFLRTETQPVDVPFSNAELADHFRRIAFFAFPNDEVHVPKPLTRWEGPIRYAVVGAPGEEVAPLMRRLARLSGLTIVQAPEEAANFVIMVLDEAARTRLIDDLQDRDSQAFMTELVEEIFDCGAVTLWSDSDPTIRRALIYLHGDLQGLYRELCYHEEISQSLGLFNDDPVVRPSIFNDDDEFALLTDHDSYLLRILYDPRLRVGTTPDQAMPVVRRIVAEIRPE